MYWYWQWHTYEPTDHPTLEPTSAPTTMAPTPYRPYYIHSDGSCSCLPESESPEGPVQKTRVEFTYQLVLSSSDQDPNAAAMEIEKAHLAYLAESNVLNCDEVRGGGDSTTSGESAGDMSISSVEQSAAGGKVLILLYR